MRPPRHPGVLVASIAAALMSSCTAARAESAGGDPLDALMMGGTFMPTPSEFWQHTIITDYIDPATGRNYVPVLVPTPESAAGTSIPVGLANVQAAMSQQPAGADYLVEGYSQSAQIAVDEKLTLIASGNAPPGLSFLLLGSGNRPDGGFLERFAGLVIPGATGFDFNGAEPTDAAVSIPTIDIANQYDGNADFPQYPVNVVADLNAVLGFIYQHAGYGDGPLPEPIPAIWPPSEPLPPLSGTFAGEYLLGSTEVVRQVDGDTTFYFIPTTDLPLLDPLRSLGVPEPVLNIFQPALQVVVEAGYDRAIPFGDAMPAELIPTIDPATFTLEFANGVVHGADNALELFGAQLPGFSELESFIAAAEAWSQQTVGVPYDQLITQLDTDVNAFTAFIDIEGPLGTGVQNLLDLTGIQQNLLDPVLVLVGSLGGLFTS